MRENYRKNLGNLTSEQKLKASRKGGLNTPYKFKVALSKQKLITLIKEFYKIHGRIPFKKEFFNAKAARTRFGSWNSAIKAAGFNPNPVKFAKKYRANDGHKCDSLAEKIVDDWLSSRKIYHQRSVRYFKTKFTVDFKVGDIFIEFFGLNGQHKIYDKLVKQKLEIVRKNNLKLISVYPKDLFPNSQLNTILGGLIVKKENLIKFRKPILKVLET